MTTPVGSIRLDLTIDGADALAKLAAQTKAALGSVDRSADSTERDLNKLERRFASIGRTAEKQAGPVAALAKAVDSLGDNYRQAAGSAEAFKVAQPSTRSLNAQAAAVDRLAAAYGRLARNQTAAAAAPTPKGPPPTSRGGGGGSGGGGRGGIGGFLTGPVGLNTIALGASALPAATLAVTNLVGAVQQLAQAGLVIPGIWATAGASIGTAVLGFKGMGDAIKALNDGDLEKITEAMKDMDPAAQNVAKSVSKFTQGPLKDLRKGLQAKMFDGISQGFDDLVAKRMPNVTKGLGGISEAWNGTLKQLLSTAGSDSTGSLLDRIFGNTAEAQKRANAAIDPLVKGIGTLAAAGSDAIPRLADALGRVATRFSNFITAADSDGRLAKWIDEGLTGVTNLGNTFLNLGKSITAITKAAGGDGGLLKLLETGSQRLADFLNSGEGQQKLTAFFADARQRLADWLPVLKNIATTVGDAFGAFQRWGDTIFPVISGLTSALASMPGLVNTAVTAFLGFKTLSGLDSLITKLTTVNSLLSGGGAGGAGGRGGAGRTIGTRGLVGGGLFLGGLLDGADGSSSVPGALATIGGGTLIGAEIGGAPGALLGTVIGTVAAGLQAFVNDINNTHGALDAFASKLRQNAEDNPVVNPGQGIELKPSFVPIPGNQITADTPLPPSLPVVNGIPVNPLIGGPPVASGRNAPNYNPPVQNTTPGLMPGLDPSQFQKIADQAAVAQAAVKAVGDAVTQLPTGQVVVKDNTPEVLQKLAEVGLKTQQLPDGQVVITADTSKADAALSAFRARAAQNVTVPLTAFPGFGGQSSGSATAGRAAGGVLPGYSPGVDNMLVPLSGGEGIIIPEAMRALGGQWLYNLNSRFRSGISRRGYAPGGVVGSDGTLGNDNTVIGLLSQIRDALVGKLTGPLSDTASGVDALSNGPLGAGTGQSGVRPFGGDIGKTFLAGIINGFGGDSRTFFPEFDQKGNPLGAALGAVGPVGNQGLAAALAKFATTGDTNDLAGTGLGAGDSVVSAIVSARNKKNGLSDQEIADLVTQVVGGGSFSGVLDDRNSSLVKSLSAYNRRLAKTTPVPAAAGAGQGDPFGPLGLTPAGGGSASALIAFAQAANGGKYAAASDLAHGLADCSGAVSDLVELWKTGTTSPARLFSTANEADVLRSLGAVPGLVPGALQIGLNSGHTAATLPNGVNFESGGAGGGVVYGGNAAGAADPQFTQQFSLPVNGAGGLTDALGSMGQDMCGCIGSNMTGGLGQLGRDLLGGVGNVAGNVGGDLASALFGGGNTYKPSGPNANALSLFKEGNPAALATLLGLNVPDLSRNGSQGAADNLMVNPGPGFDAQGRMFSDTALLIDRSMTSLQTVMEAKFQQMQDVLNQIRDQLANIASRLVSAGAQAATGVAQSAIPAAAHGAVFPGYAPGVDSIVARVSPGEGVLIPEAVRALGGARGVYAINSRYRRGLSTRGYSGIGSRLPRFADGGVVNDTVGADFFGLSEIPIIGGIVNMLISILLKIIGVEIQSRDTLHNMASQIREFRGDFQRFDASGRLASDSSGLIDRNQSSKDTVNKERVRILTQVIIGVVKYVIEKIIMPLINSAIQAAINFGTQAISSAVGMGVNAVAPGAGGAAGGITNAAVSALGSIAQTGGQIFTEFLGSLLTNGLSTLIEGISQVLPSSIFQIFDIPKLFQTLFGGVAGLIGGLVGGIGGIAGGFFDEGGLAKDIGFMPKNTIKPERVLSPRETAAFEDWMRGPGARGGRGDTHTKTTYATIIVPGGGPDTAQAVYDKLDALV